MMSTFRRFVIPMIMAMTWAGGFIDPASAFAAPSAADSAVAEKLFNQAETLMAEKKYAEAIPKLEESNRLDPALGTRFRLAECYEKVERLASAWAVFIEVADECDRTGQTERATIARAEAKRIEPLVPKLTIRVPESIAKISGLQVRENKNIVNPPSWGQALPLEPGEYTISVTAPGRRTWQKQVTMKEGVSETIVVDEPGQIPIGPIVLGSVGLAGIVVGTIAGIKAMSDWNGIVDYRCEASDRTKCDVAAVDADRKEKGVETMAHLSTSMFVVGGAALAGAAVWMFWPQKKATEQASTTLHVGFVPAPGGGSFVAIGAF